MGGGACPRIRRRRRAPLAPSKWYGCAGSAARRLRPAIRSSPTKYSSCQTGTKAQRVTSSATSSRRPRASVISADLVQVSPVLAPGQSRRPAPPNSPTRGFEHVDAQVIAHVSAAGLAQETPRQIHHLFHVAIVFRVHPQVLAHSSSSSKAYEKTGCPGSPHKSPNSFLPRCEVARRDRTD